MDSFTALADPTRRSILELLGKGILPAGDIVAAVQAARAGGTPISAPAISQHLKVLRQAGLVRVAVDGQRRIYSLDPAGLSEMEDWIGRVRRFWPSRLDALERALRQEQGEDDV